MSFHILAPLYEIELKPYVIVLLFGCIAPLQKFLNG